VGPLLLKPNLISPVWSGSAINRLRGIEGDVAYGESFDVSVHRGLVNDVEGGPYNGTPLDELLAGHRAEIMGDLTDDGVIQIITMSAAQSLSVQVHPDEAYAQAHEDDHEKTESWYIVVGRARRDDHPGLGDRRHRCPARGRGRRHDRR